MRSARRGILIGLAILFVGGAIVSRLGWMQTSIPRPAGTGAWMLTRASGLLAYMAASADVIVGLLVSTRSADRIVPRGSLVDAHSWLSPIALASIGAHALVLLADGYARLDLLDVIVPFASPRWTFAIGVGILAAYMVAVVHASFGLRKRLGTATWRRLHYLSFAALVLATIHAFTAGTDRLHPWFLAVYGAVSVAVVTLLGVRVLRSREAAPAVARGGRAG